MAFVFQYRIYRKDLLLNPKTLYIFGDNLLKEGLGGQAKEMRGEPNAFGVPTKITPSSSESAYFYDEKHLTIMTEKYKTVFSDLRKLIETGKYHTVVFPAEGIGTGLSKMPTTCPKLYKVLEEELLQLKKWVDNECAFTLQTSV